MKKLIVLSAALLLAACGSDNELSKSKVEKALKETAKQRAVCVPFNLNIEYTHAGDNPAFTSLGAPEIRIVKRQENGKRANLAAADQMDILVNAGLYHQENTLKVGEGDEAVRYMVYKITEKGQKVFQSTPTASLTCVGTEKVEKVNFFTAPTPANGITVTQVSYETKVEPERWAAKLLKGTPLLEEVKQTRTHHATLVKTNDGWRDLNELRNH
ncbi:hypothetical protein [Kingella negevensis]|uniref:hypothetical protein n=1 Tax=Kingella negevensis TaxID=1522312 RepID=UPI00050A2E29|nr:hypothetical protein [Kingella negevensis]MDK4687729.1 hypothetical protein [Kingella negevensis]WII91276.1 hypothetical protein QEO93_01385 [Kingella negevensis]